MSVLYVTQAGATVRREGGVLLIHARGQRLAAVPARSIEQLVLVGNILVTPGALDLLVANGVDTVFLSHHGKFRARLVHGASSNVRLRLAQYRAMQDGPTAMALAQAIVAGKCANMRTFLMRFARRHGDDGTLANAARSLRAAALRAGLASTTDELRGCEGSAAAAYFRVFGGLLRAPGFHFDGRNRRPPMDPVNALLSFGYTILSNAVEAAVSVVGLDAFLGALHAPAAGRPSLVCDLVEEFRAPVVDALVVGAINVAEVTPEDFEDAGPGEPVVVRREALCTVLRLLERRLTSPVHYAPLGKKLPYREVLLQQARHLARVVLGEDAAYQPFRLE